jgi:hypothetical protein
MNRLALGLLGLLVCGGCGVDAGTRAELSMRFAHPELYEGRDDFPRLIAFAQMRALGMLHRGMSQGDVRRLLGTPYGEATLSQEDGPAESEVTRWSYDLNGSSGLEIDFDKEGTAIRFTWDFDEGSRLGKPEIW